MSKRLKTWCSICRLSELHTGTFTNQGVNCSSYTLIKLIHLQGYTIGDIVDTLADYCDSKRYDPKRIYVWICFLCNNQHRIAGANISTSEFEEIFHGRVTAIGHILCMVAPWEMPEYITRVWCVFELYVASTTENCAMEIVIPPRERMSMVSSF